MAATCGMCGRVLVEVYQNYRIGGKIMTANIKVKHLCMPFMHMGGGVRGLQIGALLIPNLRDLCS